MMRINEVVMFGALLSTMFPNAAQAAIPDSRCQYAADGEYDDILSVLPWVDETVDKKSISFKRPKCFERQEVAPRYADMMLYNGIIKLVGGTVVGGASVSKFNNTPDFEAEMKMILSASDKEISSPDFAKKIASLAGRKDILEIGTRKVGGLNAFYSTTKMERRIGNTVVYRGIQRVYLTDWMAETPEMPRAATIREVERGIAVVAEVIAGERAREAEAARAFTYAIENKMWNIKDVDAMLVRNSLPGLNLQF